MRSVADPAREFRFTERDFERIRDLIHRHAGIALGEQKQDMVYSRVGRRLRARGLGRFEDYLALLEADDAAEWEEFVNALTTNLTSFFREPHHFPALAELARRKPGGLTVWCSAASTGEEPYSIAMTLADVYGSLTPPVRILASDLDTHVLERARDGVYAAARAERVPAAQLHRYFQRGRGDKAGLVRVRPELRALIRFRQINLLSAGWPVRGPVDAIFCRNVMIYFDRPTQRKVLERFAPLLANDGLLFAGHSENLHHAGDLFRPRGKTIYQPIRR